MASIVRDHATERDLPLPQMWRALRQRTWVIVVGSIVAGAVGYAVSFLLPTLYTARSVFMPPQSARSSAAAALAQLGSLGSLAGSSLGVSTPADQYVSLMQSRTAADRMIDHFGLMKVYGKELRVDAQRQLEGRSQFSVGKKDGLITVMVDDADPQRAADMANRFVDILREMNGTIALTEAQQRRKFFEGHLQQVRGALTQAQRALQSGGFDQAALQAEPRAVAEGFSRLRAEVTAAEVRLSMLRERFAENSPEVRQQQATLSTLRAQIARMESSSGPTGAAHGAETSPKGRPEDYVSLFREYKYQETLFELYARQFELARADESRDGSVVQVVDAAIAPERKSSPRRTLWAVGGLVIGAAMLSLWALLPRRASKD